MVPLVGCSTDMEEAMVRALVSDKLRPVVQAFIPEFGRFRWRGSGIQGCPWLHHEFKASLGYTRPCLKETVHRVSAMTQWVKH